MDHETALTVLQLWVSGGVVIRRRFEDGSCGAGLSNVELVSVHNNTVISSDTLEQAAVDIIGLVPALASEELVNIACPNCRANAERRQEERDADDVVKALEDETEEERRVALKPIIKVSGKFK